MKKKIVVLLLTTFCFSTLVACSQTTQTLDVNLEDTEIISQEDTDIIISEVPIEVEPEIPFNDFVVPEHYSHLDPIIASVFCSIQNIPNYLYIPNMPLDDFVLSEVYGITPDFYTDFYGEIHEMGHEDDRLLVFRTDDTEKLKQQLEDYLLSQETMNELYPTYSDKFLIRDIKIFENYVYLNMLSSYPDEDLWLDSDQIIDFYKETVAQVSLEIERVLSGGIPNE